MPDANVTNHTIPRHIVIIMDGNGRWAKKRNLPRVAGHKAGVKTLRETVKLIAGKKIDALTVYAFSSENWKRPQSEVSLLMELFMTSLRKEVDELHKNNIRLRFIGDLSVFPEKLYKMIKKAESITEGNTGLQFAVAINYGGRWDITQACREIMTKFKKGLINFEDVDETLVHSCTCLSDLPEPDLFIRTGGEQRISNYLLWQLAYTELYFSDCLWPDFGQEEIEKALNWYAGRERRFGCISEQVKQIHHA